MSEPKSLDYPGDDEYQSSLEEQPVSNVSRWSDKDMIEWLHKLDDANCELTAWEAEFIETFVSNPDRTMLSHKQRECVVRMANKYKFVR